MRIQYKVEGGIAHFPGLSKPLLIDTKKLSAAAASELHHLVDDANFFDLPSTAPVPKGAADYRRYTVTVEDGQRRHTVQLTDPVSNPHVQALLDYLNQARRA